MSANFVDFAPILRFVSEMHYICSVSEMKCDGELFGISGKIVA